MRHLAHLLVIVIASLLLGCTSSAQPGRSVNYSALLAAEEPGPPTSPERVHALLINGGGNANANYASHLEHIRELTALLHRAGVAREHVTVLSGDGDDPASDLAVGIPASEGQWLLRAVPGSDDLTRPTRKENSTIPDILLHPATEVEIARWFRNVGPKLRAGDTLLLYVTDHGLRNPKDVLDNRIMLWGRKASISVREMRTWLRTLRPGVRVVALMSQCFSGGFAWLGREDGAPMPTSNVCGYFSSRFDMTAYGCYAESDSPEQDGHSFAFLRALGQTGSFDQAHQSTLVRDRTPDVPLRTSDIWLQDMLLSVADAAHIAPSHLTAALLSEAWEKREAWDPELRLLDRLGQSFGMNVMQSRAEVDQAVAQFSRALRQIDIHSRVWTSALNDATSANWADFTANTPQWRPLLDHYRANIATAPNEAETAPSLLDGLVEFTSKRGDTLATMKSLNERVSETNALTFRMNVRMAAALRMNTVLNSIAGRVFLAAHADPKLFEAYRAMRACEGFSIAGLRTEKNTKPSDEPPPLPSIEAEKPVILRSTPPWLGVRAEVVNARRVNQEKLAPGSMVVLGFDKNSPAYAAGLMHGDVLLGPPDKPFSRREDYLPWLAGLAIGKAQPLVYKRGSSMFTATVVPRALPPLRTSRGIGQAGSENGEVTGLYYRGVPPVRQRRLLLFWATWCEFCKAAIPELLEYARGNNLPIVAVTHESSEELDAFFRTWNEPFPHIVVSDPDLQTFRDYGVTSLPTMVLLEADGIIRTFQSGYSQQTGLRLPQLEN